MTDVSAAQDNAAALRGVRRVQAQGAALVLHRQHRARMALLEGQGRGRTEGVGVTGFVRGGLR